MTDAKKTGRQYTFGRGALLIGGNEYPVTGAEVEFTVRPPTEAALDLQELGAQAFERMCAEGGMKCTRIGRS